MWHSRLIFLLDQAPSTFCPSGTEYNVPVNHSRLIIAVITFPATIESPVDWLL